MTNSLYVKYLQVTKKRIKLAWRNSSMCPLFAQKNSRGRTIRCQPNAMPARQGAFEHPSPRETTVPVDNSMLNAERAASPLEHLRSRFGWLMIPNVVLVVSAQVLGSMPVMIAATATCGLATALGYRGSLQVVNQIAPREPRAEVVSSYFVCGFCGNALPVIGVGILSTLTSTAAASYAPGGRFVLANKGASSGRLSSTWNISRAGSIGLERHAIFVEYIC